MSLGTEFRTALTLGTGRAMVAGFAHAGDPLAHLLTVRPPDDPYPDYERIRERGRLARSKLGFYATSSHELCETILRDRRFGVVASEDFVRVGWASSAEEAQRLAHPIEHSLLALDPPDHTRLRKVATPAFTPKRLRARSEAIRTTVDEFLDAAEHTGEFDLMRDFAVRVPVRVVCELLGVPEAEHDAFVEWGSILGDTLDGVRTMAERRDVRRAVTEMGEFFDELIAQRRAHPRDDALSDLIDAEPDGDPIGRREIVATAGLLIGAGFETTVNLIGNGVLALLRNPDHKRELIERPDHAADVVEEVLRYDPPVQHTGRVAKEDVTIAGTHLPRGSAVILMLAGANRDPEVFADPGVFDPRRENNREHLAFSSGVHYCLGANLARIEGEIALRELFRRFPDLRVSGPVRRHHSRTLRGMASMPLRTGKVRLATT
jgi:cytochrome P450